MVRYTFSCSIGTIEAKLDGENRVTDASPIASDYIGEDVAALVSWMREFGEIKFVREDENGEIIRGKIKKIGVQSSDE